MVVAIDESKSQAHGSKKDSERVAGTSRWAKINNSKYSNSNRSLAPSISQAHDTTGKEEQISVAVAAAAALAFKIAGL